MNMSACTLFNKQEKGSNLLSTIKWSVLGKQIAHGQNDASKAFCTRFVIIDGLSCKIVQSLSRIRLLSTNLIY